MGSKPWNDKEFAVASDSRWRANYRALQSWYREKVLGTAAGLDETGVLRGSVLPSEAVKENHHLNFLSSSIGEYARQRAEVVLSLGGTVNEDRLFRNMLSSMPLCFNLFGQLREMPDVSCRLLEKVVGIQIKQIEQIEVEVPKGYLQDRTAFDAVVIYKTPSDKRGLIAVETKYTEPFSREKYKVTLEYSSVTDDIRSGFKHGSANRLSQPVTNQLWRNCMLALKTQWEESFDEAIVLVLSCEGDLKARKAVAGIYGERTKGDGFVKHVSFEHLIAASKVIPELADWANRFDQRYLDLSPVSGAKST